MLSDPFISLAVEAVTGHAGVDDDHHEMALCMDAFLKAVARSQTATDILSAFERVVTQTRAHFVAEEWLMEKHRYSGTPAHALEHKRLLETLASLPNSIEFRDPSSVLVLTKFLRGWLHAHILAFDVPLAEALAASAGSRGN